MNKFNVGDTVFDFRYGFGILLEVFVPVAGSNRLRVVFGCHIPDKLYHLDGREFIDEITPILMTVREAVSFFKPYDFEYLKKIPRYFPEDQALAEMANKNMNDEEIPFETP